MDLSYLNNKPIVINRKKGPKESAFVVPAVQLPYIGDNDDTSPPECGIEPVAQSEIVKTTPFLETPEMIGLIGPREFESVQDCLL